MSIQSIHDRLVAGHSAAKDDTGLSMTEVITALFVFTIFILGLGYSLLSMTRLVGDDENREVAAALASQEIDRVRAVPDPFNVLSSTTTQTVNGTVFTIKRIAGWVTTSGSATSCGSSGGNLQDKAVDVQVTWVKQYVKTSPIRATTILAPSTRINDPNYGNIVVSVLGGDGTGRSGLTINAAAAGNGAVTPASIPATDASGCAYVFKVTPGTYNVSLTKSGWISYDQSSSPTFTVTVAAGGSAPTNFQFDQQATYSMSYAGNYTANTPQLPTTLPSTFFNSSGVQKTAPTAVGTQNLFPWSQGYSVVAGTYVTGASPTAGCQSIDPLQWGAGSVNGVNMAAGVRPSTGVAPGGSGTLIVPMGVIAVTWPSIAATSVRIVNTAPPAGVGDPGCYAAATYNYAFSTIPTAGKVVYLAVPFGSYTVSTVAGTTVTALGVGGAVNATTGEVTNSVVTLDPRNPS